MFGCRPGETVSETDESFAKGPQFRWNIEWNNESFVRGSIMVGESEWSNEPFFGGLSLGDIVKQRALRWETQTLWNSGSASMKQSNNDLYAYGLVCMR